LIIYHARILYGDVEDARRFSWDNLIDVLIGGLQMPLPYGIYPLALALQWIKYVRLLTKIRLWIDWLGGIGK